MPVKLCDFKSALCMLDKHFEDLDFETVELYKSLVKEYIAINTNEWTERKKEKIKECLKKEVS